MALNHYAQHTKYHAKYHRLWWTAGRIVAVCLFGRVPRWFDGRRLRTVCQLHHSALRTIKLVRYLLSVSYDKFGNRECFP